jgi:hypothetical protein
MNFIRPNLPSTAIIARQGRCTVLHHIQILLFLSFRKRMYASQKLVKEKLVESTRVSQRKSGWTLSVENCGSSCPLTFLHENPVPFEPCEDHGRRLSLHPIRPYSEMIIEFRHLHRHNLQRNLRTLAENRLDGRTSNMPKT